MKIAVVVQRYGAEISGGAELHARYIAERLARHAEVEVLTTCATDYLSWRNELPVGEDKVNGVRVRRFAVSRPRNTDDFGRRSQLVFERQHSLADEIAWLDSEGPTSPTLIGSGPRVDSGLCSVVDFVLSSVMGRFSPVRGPFVRPSRSSYDSSLRTSRRRA